jgi:hypothetical protein
LNATEHFFGGAIQGILSQKLKEKVHLILENKITKLLLKVIFIICKFSILAT